MIAWLEVLRAECQRRSQSAVARELYYSPQVVNQVLKGTYTGNVDRVRSRVEKRYMSSGARAVSSILVPAIIGKLDAAADALCDLETLMEDADAAEPLDETWGSGISRTLKDVRLIAGYLRLSTWWRDDAER